MAATYVLVPPRTMGSFMRWLLQIGLWTFNSSDDVLHFLRPVTNADYPTLEKLSERAIKEKQKFERLVVSKEKLLEMFNVRVFAHLFPTYSWRTHSTTNTSSILSEPKFQMVVLLLFIAAVPWSISVLGLMSLIPAKSKLSWSPK